MLLVSKIDKNDYILHNYFNVFSFNVYIAMNEIIVKRKWILEGHSQSSAVSFNHCILYVKEVLIDACMGTNTTNNRIY